MSKINLTDESYGEHTFFSLGQSSCQNISEKALQNARINQTFDQIKRRYRIPNVGQ